MINGYLSGRKYRELKLGTQGLLIFVVVDVIEQLSYGAL